MSLLGFDAIGQTALGQFPGAQLTFSLTASPGSFSVSGVAATFKITEIWAASSTSVNGIAATFALRETASAGFFTDTGVAAKFSLVESATVGSFVVTGQGDAENIVWQVGAGGFTIAGQAGLNRTGDNYEFKLGGIGHYLEEIERQKQLNAITRKIPGPVDRRTIPRFAPLQAAPVAPATPAPDMAAVQNQRMAEAARQVAMAKRRRDEEALLLLAS